MSRKNCCGGAFVFSQIALNPATSTGLAPTFSQNLIALLPHASEHTRDGLLPVYLVSPVIQSGETFEKRVAVLFIPAAHFPTKSLSPFRFQELDVSFYQHVWSTPYFTIYRGLCACLCSYCVLRTRLLYFAWLEAKVLAPRIPHDETPMFPLTCTECPLAR